MTMTDNAPRDGIWIEVEDGGAYTVYGNVPLLHKTQGVSAATASLSIVASGDAMDASAMLRQALLG